MIQNNKQQTTAKKKTYLKLSRSLGPRRVDLRHLAIAHLPLLRGRHELQHVPRSAFLFFHVIRRMGWDGMGWNGVV